MLPVTHAETPCEAAHRQANFIILRSLESKLPKTLFDQVVSTVSESIELPRRIDWKGESKPLTFEEVKFNFTHVDQDFLPSLLQSASNTSDKTKSRKNDDKNPKIQYQQKHHLVRGDYQNLLLAQKKLHLQNFAVDQKKNLTLYQISRFERMKTIFGHANIDEGMNAQICNLLFDNTGKFIISGADDCIIKVWDKDTMNLQASLHSHMDVITDMDISKCNQYLASSSMDGKLIIWDWQRCQKLDDIQAHQGAINNIKFFQVKIKSSQAKESSLLQILVTCSDDGTIKIYDEIGYLQSSQTSQTQNTDPSNGRRSRRQEQPVLQKKERFCITLTPDDYRPGMFRRKKFCSVFVNSNGLLAAGSKIGEIYLWKIDFQKFKQQNQKPAVFLGSAKKHTKDVHFCEFSPNGKMLFTGSFDGTARVWNIEQDKVKQSQSQEQFQLSEDRCLMTFDEKRSDWNCDSIAWSCNGRYAVAALSGKLDQTHDNHSDIATIKVYDTFTKHKIQDLAKETGFQLKESQFVLSQHPTIEEIFLSGGNGGTIFIWNISTRQLLKKFLEYGIYSYEKYTMSDLTEGKFSPDGSSFVVSSVLGTISLFSCDGASYKYLSTRVEQFYQNDNEKHNTNIYYEQDQEPVVSGFSMIPYEVQAPTSMLANFKVNRKCGNEEYERNLQIRRAMCQEEELFFKSTLEEAINNNFFQNGNQGEIIFQQLDGDVDMEEEPEIIRRRVRANSQHSNVQRNALNQNASQEEQDARQNARRNRGRPATANRPINNARVQNQPHMPVINRNLDPDNDMYDHDSDENFEVDDNDDEIFEEEEESESQEESDDEYGVRTRNRRENYHAVQERLQRGETRERIVPQENNRNQRSLRRLNRQDSEEKEVNGRRSKRRRVVLRSGDPSQNDHSDDEDFDMSDTGVKTRKRLQRNTVTQVKREFSESEDSIAKMDDDSSDNESGFKIRTRAARKDSKCKSKVKQERKRRNLRIRENRKTYEGMDSSEDEEMNESEAEQIQQAKRNSRSQEEEKCEAFNNRKKRIIKDDSEQEFDNDVKIADDSNNKLKGDEDYELFLQPDQVQLEEDMIDESKKCAFCFRIDPPLTGPFRKVNINSKGPDCDLFFHKDCIEVNDISFFNKSKNKWMNIGKALQVNQAKPSMCARCETIGATITCKDCSKKYHGYLCSALHMIFMGVQAYQCFNCRNLENYKNFSSRESVIDKQEVRMMKRGMIRDHLLTSSQQLNTFIPQINDLVYYFFQGHEKLISFYNCFFYCGDDEDLSYLSPWRQIQCLEVPTLCRVKNVTYTFPSNNALNLIKRYGKTQQVQQIPQIITKIELQVINCEDELDTFRVDLFPNNLPDFLVLKNVYEASLLKFGQLQIENKLIGQTFKSRIKNIANQLKVVGVRQREPTLFNQSNWETILIRYIEAYSFRQRGRRGRGQEEEDLEAPCLMNLWEIQLDSDISLEQEHKIIGVTAFDQNEKERIISVITDYCERKKDQTVPFMSRVSETIAPDYRQHITAEMYISLIMDRILNDYYRTQDVNIKLFLFIHLQQLFADLDLISYNAYKYNEDKNELPKIAKKVVEALRIEIKKHINFRDDFKKEKYEEQKGFQITSKPVGKLTAPTRYSLKNSSMDEFKKTLENDRPTRRREVEEVKTSHQMIQQRTYKKSKEKNEGLTELSVTLDASDQSDFKVTPKTPAGTHSIETANGRRTRRNQNINNNNNESSLNQGIYDFNDFPPQDQNPSNTIYSTGQKIVIRTGVTNSVPLNQVQSDQQLGKRTTRSGRQTNVFKQSLNEDQFDEEFDKLIEDQAQGQTNKRIKQQ